MSTSLDKFLAKATGSSALRSALRLKTEPLSMLLTAIEAWRAVQTEVPQSVLGGNIFALMSGRLQQLLQYPEQPERRMEIAPPNRARFSANTDIGAVSEKAKFSLPPASAKESANRFAPWQPARQNQAPVFPTSATSDLVVETELFGAAPFPKVAHAAWEPETLAPNNDRPIIFGKGDIAIQSKRSIQPATPILVEKLQEYWELSQQELISERSSNQLLRMENDGKRNLPSFSASPNSNLALRSWPEMTGQQIAQKLRAFASGREVSKQVQQTIHTNLPERVEIQNVFNLEVKSERAADSMADLSEKIADILREQALQHGIDVT